MNAPLLIAKRYDQPVALCDKLARHTMGLIENTFMYYNFDDVTLVKRSETIFIAGHHERYQTVTGSI